MGSMVFGIFLVLVFTFQFIVYVLVLVFSSLY